MNHLSHRGWIRLGSFLTAVVVALGVSALTSARKANQLELQMQAANARALSELSEYMDGIEVSLHKGLYANTPTMVSRLATSLWREATGAKSSLSQLPLAELQLENTYRFLSQVGEYAMSISHRMEAGERISDEERDQLVRLAEYAKTLASNIADMCAALNDGSLQFSAVKSTLPEDGTDTAMALSSMMEDAEQSLVDYPTLIYDGPFSDHIMQQTPKMTANREEISLNEATQIAARFSGIASNQLQNEEDEDGVMPSYGFKAGDITLSVTKQGGYLCYLLNPRYAGEATMTPKEAIAKAQAYLAANGIESMKESYYAINDGICVVNFAWMEGDALCYPDLIKVSVAMDTGEIVGFDARGYLMNHTDRTIPAAAVGYDQAQAAVSPLLTVMDARMALIPTTSGAETYCYEFHCKSADDEEVLVYIDAKTGMEANLLLLLYSDQGVFTK